MRNDLPFPCCRCCDFREQSSAPTPLDKARRLIRGWNAGAHPSQGQIYDVDTFAEWLARELEAARQQE